MILGYFRSDTPAWRQMVAPLRYLSIKQPTKPAFDLWWPLVLTAITVAVFIMLPVRPAILGDKGFLRGLQNLIGLLAAFFVAALAAVATVERKVLDAQMYGAAPLLNGKSLTRRQFICMLFGYLSVTSFALFFGAILADVVAPSLHASISQSTFQIIRLISGSIYALAFWNMLCTTMLGIWFLVERLPMVPSPEVDPDFISGLHMPAPSWKPVGKTVETDT